MKKKKLLIMLLVFAMIFTIALSGCGGESDDSDTEDKGTDGEDTEEPDDSDMAEDQTLRINWQSEPPSLDPQISQDATSSRILIDTLEGIIRMDEDGVPEEGSGMAESWDINEDETVYTFHLRDANWSDGEPVTANDFVFSWLRALDPEVASTYAFMAYDIKNAEAYNTGEIDDPEEVGLKAVDDKTLEVTLERPAPTFLSKLQHSTFLPAREDKVEEWGDKYAAEVEYLLSCGPFKVVEWEHESELVLEKNEDYWNADTVKLERIEGVMVNDSNTMINLYETGEIDWTAVPSQYLEKYADEVNTYPKASAFYYTYNVENEFFANKKIRQAFSMAMDRTQVQESRTQGIVPPAWGFVPPGLPGPEGKTFREANGDLITDIGNGST
ncbi:peptide ABC transporter substrate-binding protein, partial [Clostridium sp. D2Q-14]|uniref:peptide ABC transporter substrate-binding protein n=1 Tax=Anaeromonas gelatinilytica TaxID=2683194 RepID=UPI00193C1A1C